MNKFRFAKPLILAMSLAAVLSACDKDDVARLDASSQKALTESVEKMRTQLTDRDSLDKLDTALADVARFSIDPAQVMTQATKGRLPTKEEAFATVKPLVDDLSHDELLALATKLRGSYQAQLVKYESDLTDIRKRRKQVEQIAESMARFAVVAADYGEKGGTAADAFGGTSLHLKLTVQNNLEVPVSKAVMMVNFGPEGSLTPWVSQRVEKEFKTPLLPGKTEEIEVFSFFSGPAKGAEKIKPVLDAAVMSLAGTDGQVLLQTPQWNQGDVTQLNILEVASEHIRQQLSMQPDPARVPGI